MDDKVKFLIVIEVETESLFKAIERIKERLDDLEDRFGPIIVAKDNAINDIKEYLNEKGVV